MPLLCKAAQNLSRHLVCRLQAARQSCVSIPIVKCPHGIEERRLPFVKVIVENFLLKVTCRLNFLREGRSLAGADYETMDVQSRDAFRDLPA